MGGQSAIKNPRRIFSQLGGDSTLPSRVTTLENNEYKVTYYEVISGASGSLTLPTGATINAGEFGLSGNCVLSKIDGSNKPTFESPTTSGGTIVTASLNVSTGAWTASGTYTDANVALIYSIKIKAVYYSNLTYANIIETVDDTASKADNNYIQTTIISGGSLSPADATTYYFSNRSIVPTTTSTPHVFKLGFDGILRSVIITLGGNTVTGSTESSTLQLRNVTQATSSVISSSVKTNGSSTSFIPLTVIDLNIPFLGTDDICLQFDTATFATNPTNIFITIYLTIEIPN